MRDLELVPVIISILGISLSQSQIMVAGMVTVGAIGVLLFILGIAGWLFYDTGRSAYSSAQ